MSGTGLAVFVSAILAALILCLPVAAKQLAPSKAAALFYKANEIFLQANRTAQKDREKAKSLYLRAAMTYEQITGPTGIENGRLYYNTANAFFRAGDTGRAILNYLRAKAYIPNDKNLRDNLAYARATRQDRIIEKTETRVFKTLFFWHYDLPVTVRIIVFEIFFALIWILSAGRRFFKKAVPAALLYMAVFISIMFGASLCATAYAQKTVRPGVIVDESVTARKGNGESYAKSFDRRLHAGTEFVLIEKRGNWLNVSLPDGRTCWVPAQSAEMVR
ncbi:MAG: hypothetical protein GXP53_07785, partial [Deltaproteobacteria bacterium]|nr:hypothetical protein [Deltaproteobacteria bacterium]